jgi:hypothetical protein
MWNDWKCRKRRTWPEAPAILWEKKPSKIHFQTIFCVDLLRIKAENICPDASLHLGGLCQDFDSQRRFRFEPTSNERFYSSTSGSPCERKNRYHFSIGWRQIEQSDRLLLHARQNVCPHGMSTQSGNRS